MITKYLNTENQAKSIKKRIIDLIIIDTELSFKKIDNLLAQFGRFDLIKIIKQLNPKIEKTSILNKTKSQLTASTILLAINITEKN